MSRLKQKIQQKMTETDLSVAELEREAGLKGSTLRNILTGNSLNPTAGTLKALAKFFECSIDELVGETGHSPRLTTNTDEKYVEYQKISQPELFIEVVKTVLEAFTKQNKELVTAKVLEIVRECYLFFLKKEVKKPNKDFVEWIVEEKV